MTCTEARLKRFCTTRSHVYGLLEKVQVSSQRRDGWFSKVSNKGNVTIKGQLGILIVSTDVTANTFRSIHQIV